MKNYTESLPRVSQFPKRVTLELTNSCNLNCVFCPRKHMDGHLGYMSRELAEKLIDEMADNLPVTMVPFFRGESLLHRHWYEILSYAKQKGIGPIQFTSNGTRLNKDAAEKILDLEIEFISFSLDTIDATLYESTRLGAKYEKVLDNILQFLDLKKKRNAKLPQVQISAVETEQHKPGMKDFIQYWQPKVDRVRVYVEHSSSDHPGTIDAPLPSFSKRLPCHKPFEDLIVLWDGNIALCNHDWTREKNRSIGNVSSQSIVSVWNSERYQYIRIMHENGILDKEPLCAHCDHWKMFYLDEGYLGQLYTKEER
ncbi:MAG: radical SAM protein [Proteobacteria bacterium]|nr:radical SAM protein [Pseudomonadota bacterium]